MIQIKAGVLPKKTVDIEQRDLKQHCDQLRKELLRKDSRNESLSKELLHARLLLSNYERETKIASGSLERINGERLKLQNEVHLLKDYVGKLEFQLSKYSDVEGVLKQNRQQEERINDLTTRNNHLECSITLRDEKISKLEHDMEVIARSVEVQVQYESGLRGVQDGREVMRSLYLELGKKQTELHRLALSMADCESSNITLRRDVEALRVDLTEKDHKIYELSMEVKENSGKAEQSELESTLIRGELDKERKINEALQKQIAELTQTIHDKSVESQEVEERARKSVTDLSNELSISQRDANTLRRKVDSLQQSVTHLESSQSLALDKSKAQFEQLNIELVIAQQELQAHKHLVDEVHRLNQQILQERHEKMSLIESLERCQFEIRSFEEANLSGHIINLESSISEHQGALRELAIERDDAIAALQQVMIATRDLTEKLTNERREKDELMQRLSEAESANQGLRKAKENISTAVLDALHRERTKVMQLEKSLRDQQSPISHQGDMENGSQLSDNKSKDVTNSAHNSSQSGHLGWSHLETPMTSRPSLDYSRSSSVIDDDSASKASSISSSRVSKEDTTALLTSISKRLESTEKLKMELEQGLSHGMKMHVDDSDLEVDDDDRDGNNVNLHADHNTDHVSDVVDSDIDSIDGSIDLEDIMSRQHTPQIQKIDMNSKTKDSVETPQVQIMEDLRRLRNALRSMDSQEKAQLTQPKTGDIFSPNNK